MYFYELCIHEHRLFRFSIRFGCLVGFLCNVSCGVCILFLLFFFLSFVICKAHETLQSYNNIYLYICVCVWYFFCMFCILHKRTCKKERKRDKVGERREKKQ